MLQDQGGCQNENNPLKVNSRATRVQHMRCSFQSLCCCLVAELLLIQLHYSKHEKRARDLRLATYDL